MSNYIPHHTKKKQVLAKKELALERRIARSEPIDELLDAAEEVRDARVRVLQARRSTIAPKGDADARYQAIDNRIERMTNATLESILSEFGWYSAHEADD